jgi:ATPase subunit of ABC transporter with duplicated ATPase domains
MPATLLARSITVTIGRTTILDDVDVVASPGHRIGLVGPNGVGKSTLLRVLAGRLTPDRGVVERQPRRATVGLLEQEPERRPGETVRQHLARRTGVAAASAELHEAAAALAADEAGAADRYDAALTTWLDLGGADLDSRADAAWSSLGQDPGVLDQAMTTLSGGQAAKAALATILLARFDVLLLDEPTNDVDLEGLARLEEIVLAHPAAMVIVSHDRAFLEHVVTEVVELDEHTRSSTNFAGGWHAYLDERATARRHAEEAFESYTQTRDELLARARRERAWSAKGVTRAKRNPPDGDRILRSMRIEASEQLASKARRTQRQIDRLDVVDKPWDPWQLRFTIASAGRSGDVVATLDGAEVERGDFRLGPVDVEIRWAERVAIMGPNGSGKTTLLDALLGRIPLTRGTQRTGSSLVVGGVEQARRQLDESPTLLAAVLAATGLDVAGARTLLAKFGLGSGDVERPATSLSPGERTRAVLALLQGRGVNCLVLDEPTNHLDLPAIEQLERALDGFGGTVLLVSHDRRFLESVHLTREIHLAAGRIVADVRR